VSYTLAKADDSALRNAVADVYGFTRIDSASLADRRHRLVSSGIVALPHDVQFSAILDLRSDLPFNPATTLDINNDGYVNDTPISNPASPTFGTVNQLLPNINAPSRQAEFAIRIQF